MRQFLFLALAIAAMSFTISRSTMPLIVPIREFLSRWKPLGQLLHCPYCTSNWVALAALFVYRPIVVHCGFAPVDWFVSWQALVGAAMVPIFALLFVVRVE